MAQSVIGALRVNLGLDSAQFTDGLSGARAKMARFGRQMQAVGAGLSVVGAGIAFAIKGQLADIDQIGKIAPSIGLTTEALSQLRHAGEMSGVQFDSLRDGMKDLAKNMVDAESKFTALGISVRNNDGTMRSSSDVLDDVADALSGMPDGAEKTAVAMSLMGESGLKLIPMLNGGAAGLREMMQEADSLGLTISGETAAAAAQFNDNISRLTKTLTGLVTQITAQLAPVLASLTDWVVSATAGFRNLSPNAQQFSAILAGLAVVVGPLVVSVGLLVTAVAGISAPVLLAVGAITVATATIAAFWPEIIAAKDAMIDMVQNGIELMRVKFAELMEFLRGLPAQMLEIGQNIIQGLIDGIMQKWDSVKGAVTDIATGISDSFTGFFKIRSPSRLMMQYGGYLSEGLAIGIKGGASGAVSAMSSLASDINGGISSFIDQAATAITSAGSFGEAMGNLRDVFASALQGMAQSLLKSGLNALFGGLFDGSGLGSLFEIDANANGTNNFRGGLTSINERGGEIVNLPSGSQIIPNDISKRMMRGDTQQSVHVTVGIDSDSSGNLMPFVSNVVRSGIGQYDKALPDRIKQVNKNPRKR